MPARPRTPDAFRLALDTSERAAVTLALLALVGDALADLAGTLPPGMAPAALARLAMLVDAAIGSAATGRRLARRLSALLATYRTD